MAARHPSHGARYLARRPVARPASRLASRGRVSGPDQPRDGVARRLGPLDTAPRGRPLHWEAIRRRTWLQAPRHPKTNEPRPWRFLWLVVCLPLALLPLLVGNVFTASWMGLRMLRSPLAIELSPGYAKSLDLASPELSGQWWLLALVLMTCALSAFFGEEFLFRGVLLPRMSGSFGRQGWFANATLFALSYAHVPLMLPFRWLAALVTVWPARRYRCNWLAVAVRGGEGAGLVAAALAGILTPRFPPLGTLPAPPHFARRPPAADFSGSCRASRVSRPAALRGTRSAPTCARATSGPRPALRGPGGDLPFVRRSQRVACRRACPAGSSPGGLGDNANPGLGVRQLQAQGVTGRGVGIAIIDRFLLVEHREYDERLRWYEELPGIRSSARSISSAAGARCMASGVASLAVGRTVGVAPDADLYFIGVDEDPRGLFLQAHFFAQGIRRIVEINRALPAEPQDPRALDLDGLGYRVPRVRRRHGGGERGRRRRHRAFRDLHRRGLRGPGTAPGERSRPLRFVRPGRALGGRVL